MKLCQLFSFFPQYNMGDHSEKTVESLTADSRAVGEGSVFFAVRGVSQDGHAFLAEVVRKNPLALVVEDASLVPPGYLGGLAVVPDSRIALNRLADLFYGEAAQNLFLVGVTGTNGKTTCTYMIEAVLSELLCPTATMGTIDHHFKDKVWPTSLTTPDTVDFYHRLADFKNAGAEAVAFEISSHSLKQRRVAALDLDVAVFTNLSRDHLDYHLTMDDYFASKQMLFNEILQGSHKKVKSAVINRDDSWGKKIDVPSSAREIGYGQSAGEIRIRVKQSTLKGLDLDFEISGRHFEFHLPMIGLHNAFNAAATVGVAMAADLRIEAVIEALSRFKGVPGRLMHAGRAGGPAVFVDYAHTDHALESVLRAVSDVRAATGAQGVLHLVFGCGGDRDRGKRPLMGAVAARFADRLYLTSDNPRTEDPEKILNDVASGIPASHARLQRIVDRRKAIHAALSEAGPEDIVLIAGKGHEDYQIIGDKKTPFDDAIVVKEYYCDLGFES